MAFQFGLKFKAKNLKRSVNESVRFRYYRQNFSRGSLAPSGANWKSELQTSRFKGFTSVLTEKQPGAKTVFVSECFAECK